MSYRQDPRDQYYNNQPGGDYGGGYPQGQLARNQDPRDQYYNNNQLGGEYAGGYPERNYQDPRDQYYNNQTGGEYAGGYQHNNTGGYHQQGQLTGNYSDPLEMDDGYRPPNSNPYPPPNSNMNGSSGRPADDDDNVSLGSSVYSQPSVIVGVTPSRFRKDKSLETTDPRRLSLLYNEYNDYPPSPFANSTTGLTASSSQQQGLSINDQNEKNYTADHDLSQNTQPQFDVYNDFNNNNYRNDETYDEEESRHDTLTESDGTQDPNSYAMNMEKNFPSNGKGARQSTTGGEHYVVTPKKRRRCACCTRKICVIITFVVLVLLAAGLFFVWPRTPSVKFSSSDITNGNAVITLNPAAVKMNMDILFEIDSTDNWIPIKFKSLDVDVFTGSDNRPVATGSSQNIKIPGRTKTVVPITVNFDYSASEPNDGVLQHFIGACTQPPENESKTDIKFMVNMKMSITGYDWLKKPTVPITIEHFECPFNATRPTLNVPDQPAPPPTTSTTAAPTPDPTTAPAPPPTPAPADPAPPAGGAPAPDPAGGAPAPAPAGGAPAPPAGGAPAPAGGAPAPAPPVGGAPAPADGAPAPPAGGAPAPAGGAPAPGAGGAPVPAPADGAQAPDPAAGPAADPAAAGGGP